MTLLSSCSNNTATYLFIEYNMCVCVFYIRRWQVKTMIWWPKWVVSGWRCNNAFRSWRARDKHNKTFMIGSTNWKGKIQVTTQQLLLHDSFVLSWFSSDNLIIIIDRSNNMAMFKYGQYVERFQLSLFHHTKRALLNLVLSLHCIRFIVQLSSYCHSAASHLKQTFSFYDIV